MKKIAFGIFITASLLALMARDRTEKALKSDEGGALEWAIIVAGVAMVAAVVVVKYTTATNTHMDGIQ